MLTKKELLELWKKIGFKPKKSLGQNFLIDKNIKDKIIDAVNPKVHDKILEIGAGFAELTDDLAKKAKSVVAIEKDKRIVDALRQKYPAAEKAAKIICGDFLDYGSISCFTKVVGNLPYYITTPIIEKFIHLGKAGIKGFFVMVQREYAMRMLATPGTEDYSALSLFVQFHMSIEKVFKVSRSCFLPEPEVDSIFLKLKILDKPKISIRNKDFLFRTIRGSFQKRRKMLVNSLSCDNAIGAQKKKIAEALKSHGLNEKTRPEDLSLEQFGKIADYLFRE